jgi:aminoglycoside N3'-acetyltransferase
MAQADIPTFPASLERFAREILPRILSAVNPSRAIDMVGKITERDRWNSFDRWHETNRMLVSAYNGCGAKGELYTIPTGGNRGDGRWIIPEALDVIDATLDLLEPTPRRLLDYRQCPWHVVQWSAATPPEGITCELVVIDSPEQLAIAGKGALTGKLVLTRLNPSLNRAKFCHAGAAGLLCDQPVAGCPDAVAWTKFGWGGLDLWEGATPLVGFAISAMQGDSLRELHRQRGRLIVHAKMDVRRYAGSHDVVSGVIVGREDPDAEIWAVAHSAEPGALDNASGGAACVEIAAALTHLIRQGKIPQPRRTIRLLHGYECYGFFHYLEHAFRMQPPLAGVCIDTLGARPDVCGGELSWHGTVPASASFVDDIGFHLLRAALAERPVYKLQRKPFLSTEDTLIGDPKYGFPCPWITNHPCRGYHSSADTIEMLHEEGMAVCTAAMAGYLYYLAEVGTDEAMELGRWQTVQNSATISNNAAPVSPVRRELLRQNHASTIDRLRRFVSVGDHGALTSNFDSMAEQVADVARAEICNHGFPKTPVLRYSQEPGLSREEPGSSEYLRTGVTGEDAGCIVGSALADAEALDATTVSAEANFTSRGSPSASAKELEKDSWHGRPARDSDSNKHARDARATNKFPSAKADPTESSSSDPRAGRIPLRRRPLAPTPENVWPHMKAKLDSSFPKSAAYWANGERTVAEIAVLAALDAGEKLEVPAVIEYFQALSDLGYIDLIDQGEFFTEEKLVEDLSALGITPGMDVFVHSSMKSLGPVQGGAAAVVRALLRAIGPAGTLLAPTFNHHHAAVFNPLTTPTTDGAIPDAIWRRPDALRSLHPSHSVAAIGPRAAEYLADHLTHGVWSDKSPIGRLIQNDGHILSIGVGHDRSTAYHLAEISLNVPCLDQFGSVDRIMQPDGKVEAVRGLAWRNGECPVDPAGIDAMLESKQRKGKVGQANATLARAADVFAARKEQLGSRCQTCPIRPNRRNV